ncbi:MAG: NUDIX hydrolase N-terminal domain-containing protein [bacterium]|nr:NUDIX hydrolase N-terminal domain-containing protein [bacterium]
MTGPPPSSPAGDSPAGGGTPHGDPVADPIGQPIDELELLRWSEALAGIARTGLGFTDSHYERERFEEVLAVAADIAAAAGRCCDPATQITEWIAAVGEGVPGYVTPKVAVGAVVSDDDGRVLLIRRADSGYWLYPTGWADVGYSSSEIAVKEVAEETGIDCEPVRLIAVLDSMRHGFTSVPTYSLVYHCRALGGELRAHPVECTGVGFFSQDDLPSPLAGPDIWVEHAFSSVRGEVTDVLFDAPREPLWRART